MRNRYISRLMMVFILNLMINISFAAEDEQEYVAPEPMQSMELVDTPVKETPEIIESVALPARTDRDLGLLLGDELSVYVDISSLEDSLNETSFPQEDKRYGTWLYLKNIDLDKQQLVFHYQVVNVPKKNTTIATPTFDIKQNDGKWIAVPAIPITIGPTLAADKSVDSLMPKSDIKPSLISTVDIKNKLKKYSIIAAISWLILALWHFGWKPKNRQPFSQAVHDLSRLRWKRSVSADQASRILHTAFNHTGDTIVVYGEIDALLEKHSWLSPLKDEIKAFYQQSEQHFFARQAGQEPDIEMIKKLAKACRAKEMLA